MNQADKSYYLYCGIFERYHNCKLDEYKGNKEDLEIVHRYLSKIEVVKEKGIGLYLYGTYGTGKTFVLNVAMMDILRMKKGFTVHIITFADLCNLHMKAWKDQEDASEYNWIINSDFLGLDEVNKTNTAGFDKATSSSTVHTSIFESVIRYRSVRLKPTWYTSNAPAKDLEKRYSEAAYSLLKESVTVVQLKGKDYRDNIQDDILKIL